MPSLKSIRTQIASKKSTQKITRAMKLVSAARLRGAQGATADELARQVASIVVDAFVNGRTDAVYLVYNEFKSAVQQRVVLEPLLPVTRATVMPSGQAPTATEATPIDFLYEPSKKELLDVLLPQYIESQVHRALLESVASEFGARMTAMENATNNAKEMIADLTLKYNRVRQAAITKELM